MTPKEEATTTEKDKLADCIKTENVNAASNAIKNRKKQTKWERFANYISHKGLVSGRILITK